MIDDPEEGPYYSDKKEVDADILLTKFCRWQHALNDHNPNRSRSKLKISILTKVNNFNIL